MGAEADKISSSDTEDGKSRVLCPFVESVYSYLSGSPVSVCTRETPSHHEDDTPRRRTLFPDMCFT